MLGGWGCRVFTQTAFIKNHLCLKWDIGISAIPAFACARFAQLAQYRGVGLTSLERLTSLKSFKEEVISSPIEGSGAAAELIPLVEHRSEECNLLDCQPNYE